MQPGELARARGGPGRGRFEEDGQRFEEWRGLVVETLLLRHVDNGVGSFDQR